MNHNSYEFAGMNPRRLWLQTLAVIAVSCLVDVLFLAWFAATGLIDGWVPLLYGALGLACCCGFAMLIQSGFSERFPDSNLTMAQVFAWVLIELAAVALAPAAALYFLGAIFIVFSFACLRLRVRDAVIACTFTGVALMATFYTLSDIWSLAHLSDAQRVALSAGLVCVLVRFTLIQIYGNRLRAWIREQHSKAKESLKILEGQRAAVAMALHEDLGQQLAGVALMLTAAATRLQREDHVVSAELQRTAGHLNDAIKQVRTLAVGVH
jgi:signal transduction histidine kinase